MFKDLWNSCYAIKKPPRVLRYITLKKPVMYCMAQFQTGRNPVVGCGPGVGDPDIEYSVCFIFGGGEWILESNSRFLIAKLAAKFQVLFNL